MYKLWMVLSILKYVMCGDYVVETTIDPGLHREIVHIVYMGSERVTLMLKRVTEEEKATAKHAKREAIDTPLMPTDADYKAILLATRGVYTKYAVDPTVLAGERKMTVRNIIDTIKEYHKGQSSRLDTKQEHRETDEQNRIKHEEKRDKEKKEKKEEQKEKEKEKEKEKNKGMLEIIKKKFRKTKPIQDKHTDKTHNSNVVDANNTDTVQKEKEKEEGIDNTKGAPLAASESSSTESITILPTDKYAYITNKYEESDEYLQLLYKEREKEIQNEQEAYDRKIRLTIEIEELIKTRNLAANKQYINTKNAKETEVDAAYDRENSKNDKNSDNNSLYNDEMEITDTLDATKKMLEEIENKIRDAADGESKRDEEDRKV